jgi:hypothetical protein
MLAERVNQEELADDVVRIDDFPVLEELLAEDVEHKRHVRKEGGFEVTDFSILDDVLKRINQQLRELRKPRQLVFVEFSRDRYKQALGNFDREVLDRSLIIYIYCPFELCLERNKRRFEEKRVAVDDHIVPTDLMHKYYRYDDYEELFLGSEDALQKQAPTQLVVVKNDFKGLDKLERELEKVIAALRELEVRR